MTEARLHPIEIIRRLGAEQPALAVVVLSMYPESPYAVQLLKLGARAYLTKGCSSETLLAAVRAAARGQRYLTPTVSDLLLQQMGMGEQVADKAPHETLSRRQYQIFVLVAEGRSPGDIAAELGLSPSTVSTHLAAIRDKLGARTNGEVMQYAFRAGLVGPR